MHGEPRDETSEKTETLYTPEELKRLRLTEVTLAKWFPNADPKRLSIWAEQLIGSRSEKPELFYAGKADADAVEEIERAAEAAFAALKKLSDRARSTLQHKANQRSSDPTSPEFIDTILAFRTYTRGISKEFKKSMKRGKKKRGTNWQAIWIVHTARNCWEANNGKPPSPKGITAASKFADFLSDLFESLDVGASPVSAYNAWMRVRDLI